MNELTDLEKARRQHRENEVKLIHMRRGGTSSAFAIALQEAAVAICAFNVAWFEATERVG